MKKDIDDISEFKKRFKKANKANLFSPIFFSLVFIGVILGSTTDSNLELWKVILEIFLVALLTLVFWLNFLREKKKEQQVRLALDNLGHNQENENDSDYMMPQEMEMTNSKLMAFFKTQIFVTAGNGLFGLFIVVISTYIIIPTWALILSIILWVSFLLISGYILIAKHKELTSFLKSLSEEK